MADTSITRRLLSYVRWQWITVAALMSLVIALTTQAFPYLQRAIVDRYLSPPAGSSYSALSMEARLDGLIQLALVYLVVALVAFGTQFAFSAYVAWIGQNVLMRLRTELFSKLQRLPISFFDKRPVGQIVARLTSDVEGINRFISLGLVTVAQAFFVLLAVAGYMLYLDWRLALIALTALPALYGVIRLFGGRLRNAFGKLRQAEGDASASVNELITGMSTVQLHNMEETALKEYAARNAEQLRWDKGAHRWSSTLQPLVDFITSVTLAVILWYGAGRTLQSALTLGTLIAFTQYLRNFFQPLQDLTQLPNLLPAAQASAERIFKVLDEPETVADRKDPVPLKELKGAVDFNGVWFAYDEGAEGKEPAWVLRGIDLHIGAGQSVALVGATGAGKTTVLNLLARFYDASKGEVRLDGVDVKSYAQRDVRKRIGLVLQDALLFNGTIESNLRMGNMELPFERLVEVCKLVGIHDYIESLPQKYQTPVKERGSTLSTGQKQLLSFARALAPDPELLLLDEATASVDTASEEKIQKGLEVLMRGRTSVIIAHRLSTIRHCDRIVVMQKGQVLEAGTHPELLDKGGYYAKLHALSASGGGGAVAKAS